jgi:hypothetical protein
VRVEKDVHSSKRLPGFVAAVHVFFSFQQFCGRRDRDARGNRQRRRLK